jgi:hypothetical protein
MMAFVCVSAGVLGKYLMKLVSEIRGRIWEIFNVWIIFITNGCHFISRTDQILNRLFLLQRLPIVSTYYSR